MTELGDYKRIVSDPLEARLRSHLTDTAIRLDAANALLREAGYALDPYAISAELGQWGDTSDSHYLVEDGPDITLGDLRHAATVRAKISTYLKDGR